MASGVEDAGFEIRDTIAWMYGSGFPKSLDVSKAIDKAAGAEREIVGKYTSPDSTTGKRSRGHTRNTFAGDNYELREQGDGLPNITAPATPEASKWQGWGTALKPAFEPIVVSRKPLIGTVAANVLEHGTGALNIDACRIAAEDKTPVPAAGYGRHESDNSYQLGGGKFKTTGVDSAPGMRWPANIALDATAAKMLDEQSGWQKDGTAVQRNLPDSGSQLGNVPVKPPTQRGDDATYGSSGGASRFFYTAKASRHDRNAGGLADNTHPTVKPTELMRWLIRLVTPPGGIILDPFGGSGSTGLAARAENTRCILIEREPEYLQIIRDRLSQLNLFTEENQ
jgi:site-specific DNA-methyltransferase (adenine-specific)